MKKYASIRFFLLLRRGYSLKTKEHILWLIMYEYDVFFST